MAYPKYLPHRFYLNRPSPFSLLTVDHPYLFFYLSATFLVHVYKKRKLLPSEARVGHVEVGKLSVSSFFLPSSFFIFQAQVTFCLSQASAIRLARQAQMALVSGGTSALNPNAPLFIPAALRQVEDFSPQWWELVKTSTWFRDYWLSEHKEDDFEASANDTTNDDIENLLPESFDLGTEDEFPDIEHEFEQFMQAYEAQEDYAAHTITHSGGMPLESLNKDAKALLKNLTIPTSPKERGPRSPIGTAVHYAKPAQHVNVKCALRRIQQPR
ncbi:hypothetical protein L6164_023083 [Bauhinia variegata]|uniref:Uncharacterized protein n=1 Tax=Bauhinia variegata TaxID=167791 RepID=A0ACB9MJ34_BAUVA|nr:hypothetical protein L6164_023083 [Bauhinia variegata]